MKPQTNFFTDIMKGIDIRIDPNTKEFNTLYWAERYNNDNIYRKNYDDSAAALEKEIDFNALFPPQPDIDDESFMEEYEKGILFKECIADHASLLENKVIYRKKHGFRWSEHFRISNEQERNYLKDLRDIFGGRFVEAGLHLFVNKNNVSKKYFLTSGNTKILNEDLDKSLPSETDMQNEITGAIFVHNHPDLTGRTIVKKINSSIFRDNVLNSALSFNDIMFADLVHSSYLNHRIPVIMMAISENGLTYMYRGGTAKYL